MIETSYAVIIVCVMAVITVGLRAFPFLASGLIKDRPFINDLGRFLPPAIMALLVLHSLMSGGPVEAGLPWRASLATLVVIVLQYIWRHPLISISSGTTLYMLLLKVASGN